MNNWRCIHCGTNYGPEVADCLCDNFLWYTWAMAVVEDLMVDDPEPATEQGRRLSSLVDQLIAYEGEVLGL